MKLVDLARQDYFPFIGFDESVDSDMDRLRRDNKEDSLEFNYLIRRSKEIADNAYNLTLALEEKGFEARGVEFRHFIRQHEDITEILTDRSIELQVDHDQPAHTRGVHLYHARNSAVDDLLSGKSTYGIKSALPFGTYVTAAGFSISLIAQEDPATTIGALAIFPLAIGIAGIAGMIQRHRMRPALMSKGCEMMPNKPLLDLIEIEKVPAEVEEEYVIIKNYNRASKLRDDW